MELSTLFSVVTLSVVPAWLLLMFFPRATATKWVVQSSLVYVGFGLVYLVIRIVRPDLPEGGGLASFEGLMILFASPYSVLVTWIHILVIDLAVGAWMVRDGQRIGLSHLMVAPCLVLAFVAAPLGLALYCALRAAVARKVLFV